MKETQSGHIGLTIIVLLLCDLAYSLWQAPFVPTYSYADQRSYLVEAQRLLEGAAPSGPFLSESNPPFIIWFSAVPVELARWLHGSQMFFLRLITIAMMVGSVFWCVRLLRRRHNADHSLTLLLFGFLLFLSEFIIGSDFAQREHLLIILLFPYALSIATGVVDRLSVSERCALGFAAACAIWFKPQEILILAALEAFAGARSRSLRHLRSPEFLSLLTGGFFFLLCVRLFAPLYLSNTLPLLGQTFWAFSESSFLGVAAANSIDLMAVLGLTLFCIFFRSNLRDPATPLALLACSLFAYIACAMQRTSWYYHRFPELAFLQLAAIYLAMDLIHPLLAERLRVPNWVWYSTFITTLLLTVFLCTTALGNLQPRRLLHPPPPAALDSFFSQYPPSTTVYVLSTSTGPIGVAQSRKLNWGGRFAHLWMLPAIVQNEFGPNGPPAPFKRLSAETTSRLASLQRSETAEDLDRWKPKLLLVQQCTIASPCQGLRGKNFDMAAWFLQSPAFAAEWEHYRKQPSIVGFDVYSRIP